MNERFDAGLAKRLDIFASFAAVFSMAVGLSVLAGWTLHIAALLTWGAGTPMAPNAAACFVLAGLSLWLLREKQNRSSAPIKNLTAKTVAAIVSLVGLLTLAEYLFTLNLGIGRLLLLAPPVGQTATARILMSPITAGAFLLLGLALLAIDWRTRREHWPTQFLCLGAALASAFGLVGLVLGPSVSAITMALPTIVNFFVLAAGLLCSRAIWVMGGLLTRNAPETKLLRRVLPASMLALGLISWLISKALLTAVHFTWVEVSVLAVMTAAMLAGFVGWIAFIVDRSDVQRKKLEEVLQVSQEQLNHLLDRIEEPETEDRLRRRVKSGVAVAVLLTGLLGLLSWRMAQQAAENVDWVAHSQEVSTELELALRHLDDVDTGARGFALSGAQDYLDPYETGRDEVGGDLQRLRFLMADNPGQEQRLSVLLEKANSKIESSKALVAARQNSRTIPTVAQLEQGKQVMDAARLTVKQMEDEEKGVLEKRTQRARVARDFTGSIIALGSILGVIFLSIAGITVNREIGIAARARAQVKALNSDLERRVEQRTTALQSEVAARIETEAKLRASEEMFRMLLDGIKDYAVYMLDPEGRVVSWNSGAARIKGYQAEEIIGEHISCFYTEADRDRNRPQESLQEAAYTGRFEGEGWRVRKDGSTFWANSVITPLYDANGALRGYSKVVRDITDRKQAEEELKKQAALLDLAHDAILVRDLEGRIVFWNRGAQHMYGWSQGEASGRVTHELLQTKFPVSQATIDVVLASKGEWEGELRHITRHGAEVIAAARWSLQRDEHGAPTAILEISRDITDRKRSETAQAQQAVELLRQAEELRRSQQALEAQKLMLQSVLDSMTEGLVAANEQGGFILWNPAAEKILGLGAVDLPPEEWSAHYGAFLPDKVTPVPLGRTPLERAIRGEVSSAEIFFRNSALDREVWIECNGSPLRDKDGGVRGGVAAFRDITQRKADELEIRKLNEELEEKIAKRTAQLEAANQELEAFSYSVSHDLRAPLRHIGGFSKILMQDFGPSMAPEARDHLQRIEDAVIRMGQLVDGLLSLARLGRQSLKLRHTELNALVDQVISVLRTECEGREVEWRIARLPTLECDQILMGQVFQNLIGNALKYSRGKTKAVIEIGSIQQAGEPVVIFVRDNGAGFNMKYAEKLFGVFQRMHTESEFEGTGVGLATVQRIIQKHGGRVWAEAEADRGATFYFALGANQQTGIAQEATAVH
jgi:PAS domain S-box-containing protein